MNFDQIPITYLLLTAWSLFWKGIALWRSATSQQRNWFIAILVINTIGILEIVYLFRFASKRLSVVEMKSWISKETHQSKRK